MSQAHLQKIINEMTDKEILKQFPRFFKQWLDALEEIEKLKAQADSCPRPHWEWRPLREEDKDGRELLYEEQNGSLHLLHWLGKEYKVFVGPTGSFFPSQIKQVAEIRRQK